MGTDRLQSGDGNRLALAGRDLHCGDYFLLQVAGRWLPVRVEWGKWGWYALAEQQPGDGDALALPLRVGLLARWDG